MSLSRLLVVGHLVPHLVRAIPWTPLVVAPLIPLLAWVLDLAAGAAPLAPQMAQNLTRAAGVLLGGAAAFALADEMASVAASTATPRWLRMWARTALTVVPTTVTWALAYTVPNVWLTGAGHVRLGVAAVEGAALFLVALTGAAWTLRRLPERHAAAAGLIALGVLLLATAFLPAGVTVWAAAGAEWGTLQTIWAGVCVLACAGLVGAHREVR